MVVSHLHCADSACREFIPVLDKFQTGHVAPHARKAEAALRLLHQQCIEGREHSLESGKRRIHPARIRIKDGWVLQEPASWAKVIELRYRYRHLPEQTGSRIALDSRSFHRIRKAAKGLDHVLR